MSALPARRVKAAVWILLAFLMALLFALSLRVGEWPDTVPFR